MNKSGPIVIASYDLKKRRGTSLELEMDVALVCDNGKVMLDPTSLNYRHVFMHASEMGYRLPSPGCKNEVFIDESLWITVRECADPEHMEIQ